MGHKKNYMFTNKDHPTNGIMATVLGIISLAAIVVSIYLTFQAKGQAQLQYGAALILALIFSFVGVGLAFAAIRKRDKFMVFPILGMLFNVMSLIFISLILFAGAYGI